MTADTTNPPTLLIANPSGDVYGSDLQMLQTVSAMRDRGWRVVVVLPDEGPLVTLLRQHGVEVQLRPFPVLRRASASGRGIASLVAQSARALPALCRILRDVAPDVVYVNTVTIPWWIAAGRLVRIPVVCHVHEAEDQYPRPVRLALYGPLLATTAPIAVSSYTLDAISRDIAGLRARTHLIYNGVPAPDTEIAPKKLEGPFRLAVIGRLSPRKATHVALEAVALLRTGGRDARLEVCGTPFPGYEWYEQQLRDRASNADLAGAVRFSGYVSPVWPALRRAHILLAPSTREALGNVVVEAQLARRAVVATATTGHLESVRHEETGLLVPPEDPVAMAHAVSRLVDDPSLSRSLAAGGREHAAEHFSVERYRDEVFDIIGSLVSASRTSCHTHTEREGLLT